MGLVSSIYRLIPPTDNHETTRERDARLRRMLTRLIHEFGREGVLDRIEQAPVTSAYEEARAWLRRTVWILPDR